MSAVKAEIKRSILRYIWNGVKFSSLMDNLGAVSDTPVTSLEDALAVFHQFVGRAIQGGQITIGSAGIGHQVKFDSWNVARGYSPEEVFAVAEQLIEVYEDVKAMLQTNSQPFDDDSVFKAMMADDRLQTVTVTHDDWTSLRWPWTKVA